MKSRSAAGTTKQRAGVKVAIQRIVDRLVEELAPETIILYGSHAYGQPRPDSDIDLLIVKEMPGSLTARMQRVNDLVRDLDQGSRVEARVYGSARLIERLRMGDHFIQEVLDRGRLLYGRSWREERESIMADDPLAYTREWLALAETELGRMHRGFRDHDPGQAGYYLQQALEKFFKAYLIAKGWRLVRTHELKDLLNEAVRYDPELRDYDQLCETVTKWYMADRYADSGETPPTEDEAQEGAAVARGLIEKLRGGVTG